jgi:hypothetical protein
VELFWNWWALQMQEEPLRVVPWRGLQVRQLVEVIEHHWHLMSQGEQINPFWKYPWRQMHWKFER